MRVDEPEFDEFSAASLSAEHIGAKPPIVQDYGDREALESYPELIEAAEAPVIDTACGALLQTGRARPRQRTKSRPHRRRRRRMAGRLSMVQSGQADGISRRRAGIESERLGAARLICD